MSHSDSIKRVIEIIGKLNDGKEVSTARLAQIYEVHPRTIRRDLALIKEIFGDFMTKDGDTYRAYERMLLDKVLSAAELMQLSNIVNVLNITNSHSAVSDRTKSLVEHSNAVYSFKSKPYEHIENHEVLRKVEHAIKYRQLIELIYTTNLKDMAISFAPYKILFLNENFYLIGRNKSTERVEFLRLSMINNVATQGKTFMHEKDIDEFIERIQTPWAEFSRSEQSVMIRVDKKIKKYFLLKNYLPSQKIIKEYPNGDLQLEFMITRFQEIEEFIIKWLPSIRVLHPKKLELHVAGILERKLRDLKVRHEIKDD